MRLPVIPVEGDEKWELLSKIVDKLETRLRNLWQDIG